MIEETWNYQYSDMVVDSTLHFPELTKVISSTPAHVQIRSGPGLRPDLLDAPIDRTWTMPDGSPWTTFRQLESDWFVDFPDFCGFLLAADGTRVTCYPQPGTGIDTVRHLILNQILPLVLSARGCHTFHASAVEVEGRAAVFSGQSGAGKSTLALDFARNGERFLSDDLVVFEKTQNGMEVVPSYPSLRVCSDTLDQAGAGLRVAPSAEYNTKSRLLAGESLSFQNARVPLGAIYLIGAAAPAVEIEEVKGAEAIVELVRASFVLDASRRDYLKSHFDRVADLSSMARLFRLRYPRDFERLPEVRGKIADHIRSLG